MWNAVCDASCLNSVCRKLNKEVCGVVVKKLGLVIGYLEFCLNHPWLYRGDGFHLSDEGLEVFLSDLHRGLHAKVFGLMGGMGHS